MFKRLTMNNKVFTIVTNIYAYLKDFFKLDNTQCTRDIYFFIEKGFIQIDYHFEDDKSYVLLNLPRFVFKFLKYMDYNYQNDKKYVSRLMNELKKEKENIVFMHKFNNITIDKTTLLAKTHNSKHYVKGITSRGIKMLLIKHNDFFSKRPELYHNLMIICRYMDDRYIK